MSQINFLVPNPTIHLVLSVPERNLMIKRSAKLLIFISFFVQIRFRKTNIGMPKNTEVQLAIICSFKLSIFARNVLQVKHFNYPLENQKPELYNQGGWIICHIFSILGSNTRFFDKLYDGSWYESSLNIAKIT